MPMLALTGKLVRRNRAKLRLRLFSTVARLVTTGRRRILRLAHHGPWVRVISEALARLEVLPNPQLTSTFPSL